MRLSEMKLNVTGRVTKIECKGTALLRLLNIGIHPGTQVTVKWTAPLGDPLVIEAGDTLVGIRKRDAGSVEVTI